MKNSKKNSTEVNKKEVMCVSGTFNFCISIKDLEKMKKNPKCKSAIRYKKDFLDAILSIKIPENNK